MSLDITLTQLQPVSVFDTNITHNLGKMASQVQIEWNGISCTLYQVLWRPDELGFTQASEISELLDFGWNELLANPEKFKEYNPPNGWGNYDNLCNFVYQYRNACWDNPNAQIEISR
jgi:hypothetical protein